MTDTSPAAGWWKASDGQWYPPRWEYHYHATPVGRDVGRVLQEAMPALASFGDQGWELVNFNVLLDAKMTVGHSLSVVFLLKRPRGN